jgi:hypothetical protein
MRKLMILGAAALALAGCQGARGGYGYGYGYEYDFDYGPRRPAPYYSEQPAYGPGAMYRSRPGWSLHREPYPGAPPWAPERYIWRRDAETFPDP